MGGYGVRKQGECKACKAPLYGDDYGPLGHDCPLVIPDGWISCSKQMPPQDKWVHVHVEWAGSDEYEVREAIGYWTGSSWRVDSAVNYLPEHITHWHRFPEFSNENHKTGEKGSL